MPRDREPREDDRQVQDSEAALMDTIKAILEILMAAQIVSVDTIEMMLMAQRAKYAQWRTPGAEGVIDLVLTFLRDQRRREFRERLGVFLGNQQQVRGQERNQDQRVS